MLGIRINSHIADVYFWLCRMDNDIPSYEGLKEFARACHHG